MQVCGSYQIKSPILFNDAVKDQAIYKTIRVTVLSKELSYKKDDIPL